MVPPLFMDVEVGGCVMCDVCAWGVQGVWGALAHVHNMCVVFGCWLHDGSL
jgi:hypothetical protein